MTVVEWGEGLAEGLSADRLEIAIDERLGRVRGGPPGRTGRTGDDAVGPATTPRTVRISAVGERWEGIELPLLGLADRL